MLYTTCPITPSTHTFILQWMPQRATWSLSLAQGYLSCRLEMPGTKAPTLQLIDGLLYPPLYIVGSTQLFPFQLHILLKLFYLSMSTDTFLKISIDCKRTSDIFKILDTIVISCCKRCEFREKEIIDKLFLSNR